MMTTKFLHIEGNEIKGYSDIKYAPYLFAFNRTYEFDFSNFNHFIDFETLEVSAEIKEGVVLPNPTVKAIERQIGEIKQQLSATDYQALKFAEGQISIEDYAPMRDQRQAWREEINRLEATINGN